MITAIMNLVGTTMGLMIAMAGLIVTMMGVIINLIVTSLKELITDVAKATILEKIIMIGLWVVPIPMTLEIYLVVKRILRKKRERNIGIA